MVKLDILSDPICPWCYIGKTQLDRALAAHADHPFEIEWHPFQLNPDMPAEGMDRQTYLDTKFGGRAAADGVYSRINEAAKGAGLAVRFDQIKRTPNTLNAHRLIHWSGLEGRQTATVTRLFKAYFEAGEDIGDDEVLLNIAEGVGMERDMISRLLASDADASDIQARDAHARARGVNSVPTFILGNAHVVPGAQPTELWERVLDDLKNSAEDQA